MAWDPRVEPALSASSDPADRSPGSSPARGGEPEGVPPLAPGHPLEPLHGTFGTASPGPSPWAPTPDDAIVPRKYAKTDWGESSLGLSPTTAAGISYLGWWFTGLLVYFNERRNWYVRFHALQSVLYTSALTVISVVGYVVSSLLMDLFLATHQPVFRTLGYGLAVAILLAVLLAWLVPLIAAWCGFRLRIPYFAPYAERYAAPFPEESSAQSTTPLDESDGPPDAPADPAKD